MKRLYIVANLLISIASYGQAPQLIPYQAIARDASGQPLANAALNARFTIHDQTAIGATVWQEIQTVTTSALGLFTAQLGSSISLASVNWGGGSKFMQVEIDLGSGFVDIGTQQMFSVPYAMYSQNAANGFIGISQVGDTLYLANGTSLIIPGISISNGANAHTGAALLPYVDTCEDQLISVTSCAGQTSIEYDGRVYDLVEIEGQCWFAENLASDQYRNGDEIQQSAWSYYNNDSDNDLIYGKLYNWYAVSDSRGLCPAGWHVPSDCEWMFLEKSLGMSLWVLESYSFRETDQGAAMKSTGTIQEGTGLWNSLYPGVVGTNSSGFSGIPGGSRSATGSYSELGLGNWALWWSSTQRYYLNNAGLNRAWSRGLYYASENVFREPSDFEARLSVRCLKD